jgi:cobalt-zinc-cadmium efflux system protein
VSARHHPGHSHSRVTNADIRSLLVALSLLSAFLLVEVLMAILSDSLALLADAGHMLTDVAALSMSAWAIRLARRPPQGRWTFGLKRAEILSAAVNGVTLLAIALLIAVEAVQRLLTPRHVDGGVVLTVAILGATINVLVGWILSRADRTSLNIRGAYLHIITDLFAFIATAIAGLVIVLTRWEWADAIASMFVVALMLVTSWGLLRDAGKILLQASPDNLDLNHVRGHLVDVDHVLDIHDLHAWTVTSGQTTLSAHVVVEDHCFDRGHAPQILDALQQCLIDHFDIEHATFQLEPPAHEAHEEGLHP